jgi:carbon storage regulator
MLVLTRRPGEQIIIGDDIRLTVVSLGPGRVKIGIDAPPNVRIDREEVHQKIQKELAEASDVLAVVGRVETEEPNPTAVLLSGETATKVHNRIAAPAVAAESGTPVPVGQRLTRKPR